MAKQNGPFDANPYNLAPGTTYFVEVAQFTSGASFASIMLVLWNFLMIVMSIGSNLTATSSLLAGLAWVAINQVLGIWVLVGRKRVFIPRKIETDAT